MSDVTKRNIYAGSHTTMHLAVDDYFSKNAPGKSQVEWLFFTEDVESRFSVMSFHFNGWNNGHYLIDQEVIGDWMAPGFVITDIIGLELGKFIVVGSTQYSYGALVMHVSRSEQHPVLVVTVPSRALNYNDLRCEPLKEHLRDYHVSWADMFAKQLTYWPENIHCRTYIPIPDWYWRLDRETGEMALVHTHFDFDGDGVLIAEITKAAWERSRADYLATLKETPDVECRERAGSAWCNKRYLQRADRITV